MSNVALLADRYWELYLAVSPRYATLIGDHRYDNRLEDLTDVSLSGQAAALRSLRKEVVDTPPDSDAITRSMLLAAIDRDLTEYDTSILIGAVDSYLGVHSSLLSGAAQTSAMEPNHALDLATRYSSIPTLLDQALTRHLQEVEAGRPPAEVSIRRVIDQIDAYLTSSLDNDAFVATKLPVDWTGTDTWRAAMAETVADVIRPAYALYREGLISGVLPHGRDDDHVGICHVVGGEAIYQQLVDRFVTTHWDPGDIHTIGLDHATDTLVAEYADIGDAAFGESALPRVLSRMRSDPALRYSTSDEMLDHAEAIVARAWASIDGWLGARPDGPCQVLPVPSALAKDMPPAYYMQPAPDGSRPGTYFLNTHDPTTRDRFASEAVAFHEAIPGHHFDRALASTLTGIPTFRRMQSSSVHAEGWGLYSERLADEMGLYSGPIDRLGMLSADSWRAGRLVVDTGMHLHGWSRSKAVGFLRDWSAINLPTIDQEIDRYIGWPGQALSYKMGHIQIQQMRSRAEEALGATFDIVGFHDTLLTSGGLTMPILNDLVDEWINSQARGS